MMNSVNLIGNLATDVTTRNVGEQTVASFKLAVNRPGQDKGADFFWVQTWNGSAEACAKYLGKGHEVGIIGELRGSSVKNEDGTYTEYVKVNARRVQFLRRPNGQSAPPVGDDEAPTSVETSAPAPNDDGIPF
jgi:single-strand DNA-binding protein